jgi:hypothetical protein
MKNYILVNGKPTEEPDFIKFGRWFETADRKVDYTKVEGHVVSTVFLGIDHGFGEGKPVLFETMIFGDGEYDQFGWRWHTMGEAKNGHHAIVDALKEGKNLNELSF